jgi:hypothetical protein
VSKQNPREPPGIKSSPPVKLSQAPVKGSQAGSSSVKQFGGKKRLFISCRAEAWRRRVGLSDHVSRDARQDRQINPLHARVRQINSRAKQKPTEAGQKMKSTIDLSCEGTASGGQPLPHYWLGQPKSG